MVQSVSEDIEYFLNLFVFYCQFQSIVYTYLLAMRTIASLLSPETPTISQPRSGGKREIVGVEGDNKLAIVRIASK
jgi:hypothetical protein